ncbi:hypothetical protein CKO51_12300 [Rhodopirellula sp. SM50]|nr:hypothetical protein CKO51_12300 [Rhodopirellula sp. SM50]
MSQIESEFKEPGFEPGTGTVLPGRLKFVVTKRREVGMAKFVIIGVVILVAASIGIFQYLHVRTNRAQKEPGFREFVKDPNQWNEMIAESEDTGVFVEDAESWDSDQITQQIKRYVFGSETTRELWALGRQLKELSPRTNDALLAILKDESLNEKLSALQQGDLFEEAPIMRVCELFDGNLPAEAIALLTPALTHPSDQVRKECGLAIAESGWAEALPAIKQSLADDDEYVRSYALMGMTRAIEANKLSAEIRSGVLPDLENLVASGRNVEDAARLFAQLDAARAESFLLSDAVLDPKKNSLHEILRVIGQFDFSIDRETVKSLVATYAGREMEYPNTYALGEALALLGRFKVAEDTALLKEYCSHSEDRVSDGAARGLLASHDLRGFQDRTWQKEESGGWESLNREQQMYLAVFWLDAEVNNGGHSQYFFNSAGANWQLALDGLEAMGFKQRLEIFEGVLKLFGDQKPFRDRGKRQDQLASVYTQHEGAFDKFDSQYYKAKESVEVFSTRFVIENADKFK